MPGMSAKIRVRILSIVPLAAIPAKGLIRYSSPGLGAPPGDPGGWRTMARIGVNAAIRGIQELSRLGGAG